MASSEPRWEAKVLEFEIRKDQIWKEKSHWKEKQSVNYYLKIPLLGGREEEKKWAKKEKNEKWNF